MGLVVPQAFGVAKTQVAGAVLGAASGDTSRRIGVDTLAVAFTLSLWLSVTLGHASAIEVFAGKITVACGNAGVLLRACFNAVVTIGAAHRRGSTFGSLADEFRACCGTGPSECVPNTVGVGGAGINGSTAESATLFTFSSLADLAHGLRGTVFAADGIVGSVDHDESTGGGANVLSGVPHAAVVSVAGGFGGVLDGALLLTQSGVEVPQAAGAGLALALGVGVGAFGPAAVVLRVPLASTVACALSGGGTSWAASSALAVGSVVLAVIARGAVCGIGALSAAALVAVVPTAGLSKGALGTVVRRCAVLAAQVARGVPAADASVAGIAAGLVRVHEAARLVAVVLSIDGATGSRSQLAQRVGDALVEVEILTFISARSGEAVPLAAIGGGCIASCLGRVSVLALADATLTIVLALRLGLARRTTIDERASSCALLTVLIPHAASVGRTGRLLEVAIHALGRARVETVLAHLVGDANGGVGDAVASLLALVEFNIPQTALV